MARQEGIEPPTHSLEGCCSIQLSYWRFDAKVFRSRRRSPRTALLERGARIGTGDLLLPKQARYQATLRPASLPMYPNKSLDSTAEPICRRTRPKAATGAKTPDPDQKRNGV